MCLAKVYKILDGNIGQIDTNLHPPIRKVVAVISVITPSMFVILNIVIHLLNSDVNWIQNTLSDIALMRYGWIETASTCILGLCAFATAYGLYFSIKSKKTLKSLVAILAIAGLALFIIAAFPISDSGIITPQVVIHRGALVTTVIAFPIACLLMALSFRSDMRWRSLVTYCIYAGVISIVLDLVILFISSLTNQVIEGLWEKVSLMNGVVLFQVIGVRLFMITRTSSKN